MKLAGAIVTNRGGRTCHAAIIARELGIPAVVGCGDATSLIQDGKVITVSCVEGEVGYVYQGNIPFTKTTIDVSSYSKPKRTKLVLNIADPGLALTLATRYKEVISGVGLVRLELLLNKLGVHPRAVLEYETLDKVSKKKIAELSRGYDSPRDYYVSGITEGVATIAAAFYPKPVIVRLSDFKSNEYRKLLGGDKYEPREENPMIGFRGASRYPSQSFSDCFKLECEALRRARNEMGLTNIEVMVPFVRTPDEGRRIIQILSENGLRRSDGLRIICMCEIPANVISADDFLDLFDGFSIGSNDLTQLTLGVDRDSGMVGEGLDERSPAVLKLIQVAVEACKRRGKYSGICGQAPSDFPEITKLLVTLGIDSISLNSDSIYSMLEAVTDAEKELGL